MVRVYAYQEPKIKKRPMGKGQTPHYIAPTPVVRRVAVYFGGYYLV